jgi:hypothetical protein
MKKMFVNMKTIIIILMTIIKTQNIIQSLNGEDWRGYNHNNSIEFKGKVPGNNFIDLLNSKIITNPYFRFNDMDLRWVSNMDCKFINKKREL